MELYQIALQTWPKVQELSEAQKWMVISRLSKCDVCPHKRQIIPEGNITADQDNDPHNEFFCNVCGCKLENRVTKLERTCPDTPPRWTEEKLA